MGKKKRKMHTHRPTHRCKSKQAKNQRTKKTLLLCHILNWLQSFHFFQSVCAHFYYILFSSFLAQCKVIDMDCLRASSSCERRKKPLLPGRKNRRKNIYMLSGKLYRISYNILYGSIYGHIYCKAHSLTQTRNKRKKDEEWSCFGWLTGWMFAREKEREKKNMKAFPFWKVFSINMLCHYFATYIRVFYMFLNIVISKLYSFFVSCIEWVVAVVAKRKKASYSRIFYVCTFGWYAHYFFPPTYFFPLWFPFIFLFSPSLFSFLFLLHLIIIMRERESAKQHTGRFFHE